MIDDEQPKDTGRKLVQELSEAGGDPPPCYVQEEESRPGAPAAASGSSPPPAASVPVIDLRRLARSDSEGEHELAELRSALLSWGLFQAVGHGISDSLLAELRNAAKTFFHLPMEAKQKYKYLTEGKREGYSSDPIIMEGQTFDWNDRLYLLVQPESERTIDIWPENPSSFREILDDYSAKLKKVVDAVLMAVAKSLKLNEHYFTKYLQDEFMVYARFNYYPRCSRPDLVFGIKPHSDGSLLTVLLPDNDVEGLQVLKDGEWIMVMPDPDALLINLGDEMEIMTNGIYKSPVHRVLTNSEKERISLAMFHALSQESELGPAEELVDEMQQRLYRKLKLKDYLQVFAQNFLQGKRAIDCAKI